MTENRLARIFREGEWRIATGITVSVWFVSSILFVVPMLVAGTPVSFYLVASILAIAVAGSLVSLVLMAAIWRLFESGVRPKIVVAGVAIVLAAILLTLLDLAAAGILTSIQPGNQMSSSLTFRAINNFAVFVPHFGLLGAIYALLADTQRAARQERMLAEANTQAQQAKLSALRYQLNPHFLFNTLNSISSLVVTKRNSDAEAMLTSLSEFLRTTLAGDPNAMQTLEGELETIDTYLGLERIRFGQRLEIVIDCPAELREAQLPHFLLQPLVENSVKHGLAPSDCPVTIRVSARAQGSELMIAVENDCCSEGAAGNGTGVGLRNVHERLETVYGERGRLETIAREAGFIAIVRLPLEFTNA
ncbi:histidine kinase [Altererythrobacter arenosus]|uniref:Histidine kinase n=1 Tax=Altererythrobacter arenosus TaxID=3032592 RepID=A0ABY8FPD5_9SPHN|nr:histidine kinase [Altererythrobacter sp. CAU 1644]WFL76135.1 histidine kinase [Altererythrobacter sp. CAU 1644]